MESTVTRSRDEHLAWCKKRALEYLDLGDVANAVASMGSDLRQHEELKGIGDKMAPLGLLYAINNDVEGARRWIVGFR
jgi:hypothetical protein